MTRINCIPPSELCDQHLLAEHRELTRIPNALISGRAKPTAIPATYRLGPGHVSFFYNKLGYLKSRYRLLCDECLLRGFRVAWRWPNDDTRIAESLWHHWQPDTEAQRANRARIAERLAVMRPRYSRPATTPMQAELENAL